MLGSIDCLVTRVSSLADALPPPSCWVRFASGGYFAAVVGCFRRMLCRRVWLIGWMLYHLCWVVDLYSLDVVVSASRFSCRVLAGVVGLPFVVSVLLCCCSCCFFLVCVCVFLVFFISPLCSCVGQALLGCIKIVSVTSFLLMKNVLRCEKKSVISSTPVRSQ